MIASLAEMPEAPVRSTSGSGTAQFRFPSAAAKQPSADTRLNTTMRLVMSFSSKRHGKHRTDLHRSASEHRARLRQFHRLVHVARLDDHEAEDEILGFEERSVRDHWLLTSHHFSHAIERL